MDPPRTETAPSHLGRFRLVEPLGEGSTGRVWLALDPALGRQVAVKVLHHADHRTIDRFLSEARITAQLDHPAVVGVHEIGEHDGVPFLVMRRVMGRSLADVMESDAPESPGSAELLDGFIRVCQAVGYAHGRGVVHRDLKPANLLWGHDGEVVVVDWGLAAPRRDLDASPIDTGDRLPTLDGAVVGTLGYLAPEAARGRPSDVGPASDVFSLCAILFELLAGHPAIDGDDLWLATLRFHPDQLPACPQVDPALHAICLRGLQPEPSARWADGRALARALRDWREGRGRLERADRRVGEGRAILDSVLRRLDELRDLQRTLDDRHERLAPWLPIDHPDKAELHRQRERLEEQRLQLALDMARVEAEAEAAARTAPSHPGAHDLLADTHRVRFREAERDGRRAEAAYHRERLSRYDRGQHAAELATQAHLVLHTEPAVARITAHPVVSSGLLWSLGAPVELGSSPLDTPLPPGSWVLRLHGLPYPVVYPVQLRRGQTLAVHDRARPLRLPDHAPEGFRFVAGGPFVAGGDRHVNLPRPRFVATTDDAWVATWPVRADEWASWIARVAVRDRARARRLLPRASRNASRPMWPDEVIDGASFPLVDVDGDTWHADWPICGIRWADAVAYAQHVGRRLELPVQLITEAVYEKAARGVDGRAFPWGDTFDPALCKSVHSRPGTPRPESVGAFPTDTSVYGVRDLAGGMRTWCADPHFDGDPALRPMRGGYWGADHRLCRAANRYGMEPDAARPGLGLRLMIPVHP